MSIYVLTIVLLLSTGEAQTQAGGYKTMAECQAVLAKIPEAIAQDNSKNEVKIKGYVAACKQMEKAPQGVSI